MVRQMKLRYILVLFLTVGLAAGCVFYPQEVEFARRVFTGLVRGRRVVAKYIDWHSLKATGVDVGATYNSLASEKERRDYRKAFIQNFSFSFRTSGGRLNWFKNWRIHSRDSRKITVAADAGTMTLLLYISADPRQRKLLGIEWGKVK
jgi:hypothetical protein